MEEKERRKNLTSPSITEAAGAENIDPPLSNLRTCFDLVPKNISENGKEREKEKGQRNGGPGTCALTFDHASS